MRHRYRPIAPLLCVWLAACAPPGAPSGTPGAEFDAAVAANGGATPPGMVEAAELASPPPRVEPSRAPRLFGFLLPAPAAPDGATGRLDAAATAGDGAAEAVQLAAAAPPDDPGSGRERRPGGLFGLFRGGETATSTGGDVGLLAFGDVAEACGVARRDLGTEIARSDAGYRLYDTLPSTTAPRTHYLTGFRDGCPRRFTAALALFGSPEVHEATRYNPLNASPYSATDTAYERVKGRVCNVGRGQPCPENRMRRMERDSAFVSVYRSFGDSGLWLELFLHRGDLVTQDMQGG